MKIRFTYNNKRALIPAEYITKLYLPIVTLHHNAEWGSSSPHISAYMNKVMSTLKSSVGEESYKIMMDTLSHGSKECKIELVVDDYNIDITKLVIIFQYYNRVLNKKSTNNACTNYNLISAILNIDLSDEDKMNMIIQIIKDIPSVCHIVKHMKDIVSFTESSVIPIDASVVLDMIKGAINKCCDTTLNEEKINNE